jgi:hypothetical protein
MLSVAARWWMNEFIVSRLQAYNWTNDANRGQKGPEFSDYAVAERWDVYGFMPFRLVRRFSHQKIEGREGGRKWGPFGEF